MGLKRKEGQGGCLSWAFNRRRDANRTSCNKDIAPRWHRSGGHFTVHVWQAWHRSDLGLVEELQGPGLTIMYASYITHQTATACTTRRSYSNNFPLSYGLVNIDVLRIHGEILRVTVYGDAANQNNASLASPTLSAPL
ncbi:hypothetical protein E2C01_001705 [Portunus trituberculatus]|uniref:Uncharacterized protein n=1 Tax=Portunus trituberculatus TaxID=210409 RepID=A0A5B7CHC5_PORTR|nr:hypothetical protein [Portunus trituberculatus]